MAELASIKPGDIVEADVRGHRAFAVVEDKLGSGRRATLSIRPITKGFNHRQVSSRQIVNHWRKTKNTKRIRVGVQDTGHDADE